MANYKIPEVPLDITDEASLYLFLSQLRDVVVQFTPAQTPARPITNLVVTPMAGGNIIDFTRSDGTGYFVYWNINASFATANAVDVSNSNRWVHNYGTGGATLYYWIVADKPGVGQSDPVGPKIGVTLSLGTAITPPTPQPGSDTPVKDDQTGRSGFDIT